MFAASFISLVLASAALAGPMKRDGGLTVNIAGPSDAGSADDLQFSATIENTGSETVKILKYGTILDDLPTRSFKVTKDGEEVSFTGIKACAAIDLEAAGESAYAVIPAGESITVNHNIGNLFDFATAGAGNFKFEPLTGFQVLGSEEASFAPLEELEVSSNAVEVSVSQLEKQEVPVEKRATNICPNASQKSFIDAAYTESKQMATAAANYISSNGANSLYTSYFKTNPTTTIRNVFTSVANENTSSRTMDCRDTYSACRSGVIAYAVVATTNIYFCPIFFNQVPQTRLCGGGTSVAARNLRGGTMLHEMTHAVAGTDDVVYGCAADRGLSAAQQRINADNYNCFGAEVWLATRC
ncbi:hypothetical protein PQX77_014330 [Marasmius sp. AFHP31]|nr:hypothetical protein PQX77_014330 [Marasmius sp. AFHP31]